MEAKNLKRGLLGYSKKSVTQYIDEIVSGYGKLCAEYKDEISQLKKQNSALLEENTEKFKRLDELEGEREYVAKAVISAEISAKRILEEAEKEAGSLKANKTAELALAEEELRRVKGQIQNLKSSMIATLRKYEAQMEELIGDEPEPEQESLNKENC